MPFGATDDTFGSAAAEFLKTDKAKFVETIGQLESLGVVVRHGHGVRIIPDVLGDHILHHACLNPQGERTGFVESSFEKFGGVCPSQLLRNLAELDWRVKHSTEQGSIDLLTEVWDNIIKEFTSASATTRTRIIDVLMEFSHYQPRRILELVEFAMRNPSQELEDEGNLYQLSHSDVKSKLPGLLRYVGFSLEWVPRACDLLWELGWDDDRPLNLTYEYALRVLSDLASYDIEKPVAYNAAVMGCVERWTEVPGSGMYVEKLCDILDQFLTKTGHSSRSEGVVITLRSFRVSEPDTRRIRDRAICVLEKLLASEDLTFVLCAVKSFGKVLDNPMSLFNAKITEEECRPWASEQLKVLDLLAQFRAHNRFAIATLRVLRVVRSTVHFNLSPTVKNLAAQLRDSIPQTFDLLLTELLVGECRPWLDNQYDSDPMASLSRREATLKEMSLSISETIITDYPDPADGLKLLSAHLDLVRTSERLINPTALFITLGEVRPDYSRGLCEAILRDPESSSASLFGVIVTPIRRSHPEVAIDLLRRALKSAHEVLWLGVASFYYHPTWIDSVCDEDVQLIETLVSHRNAPVRFKAIGALWNLGKARPETAKRLVLAFDTLTDPSLAEEFFMRLNMGIGGALGEYDDQAIDLLIQKLSNVDELDNYFINSFLVFASRRRPVSVLRLLLDRIDAFDGDVLQGARALPPICFNLKLDGIPKDPCYPDMLREVRDRALAPEHPHAHLIPGLFKEITLDFTTDCWAILGEWLETNEKAKVEAVARLLDESPPDFIFTRTAFVERILGIAHAIGDECFDIVCHHLQNPSITEGREGVVGQPFPQDVILRDKATASANSCQIGSPQWKFYDSLANFAVKSIRAALLGDA
jgi:hypothetical protein